MAAVALSLPTVWTQTAGHVISLHRNPHTLVKVTTDGLLMGELPVCIHQSEVYLHSYIPLTYWADGALSTTPVHLENLHSLEIYQSTLLFINEFSV